MNQKINSEIKSIAKEIESSINLNTSELKHKVSELYNKLVVLEFLENSIINIEETSVEKDNIEELTEKAADTLEFSKEEKEEVRIDVETKISIEKIEEVKEEIVQAEITTSATIENKNSINSLNESIDSKKSSLHEELKKNAIQIGLNDRIAFVKRLFDGNQQDFHRVLSQVNTFSSIDEVKEFIDTMVRPEHNWENHEEYADRFMEIIEVKFQ